MNLFSWEYGFSFGLHYLNESFSIVHILYHSKQIEHLQFAFYNPIQSLNGTFYIGGIPNNTHLVLPYKGIIKVNESLPTWGFNLNTITYNNSKYSFNIPCIINSAANDFSISDEFYSLMKNVIFKEWLENGTCKEVCNVNPYSKCFLHRYHSMLIMELKEEIEFEFGNTKINFTMKELLIKYAD